MMLLKEVLNQPTRGPPNQATRLVSRKKSKLGSKNFVKPTNRRNADLQRKKTIPSKSRSALNEDVQKSSQLAAKKVPVTSMKTTSFDAEVPSSTPIFTPVKKEKLTSSNQHQPVSISSSQCSLIELLQQYNTSNMSKPLLEKSIADLELTLTPDEENRNPKLQTFHEVLSKLRRTVQPHNLDDGPAMKHAFADVKAAFASLIGLENLDESERAGLMSGDNSCLNEAKAHVELLQSENISLQRQLRIAKREIQNKENKSMSSDINLEMVTLKCQKAALEQKVKELNDTLEKALSVQQTINSTNDKLSMDNARLQSELEMKNNELRKSGQMFSTETQQIKQDVSQALEKVCGLKDNLSKATDENEILRRAAKNKDDEIMRLTELNKGLQNSVSRLLQDLSKVPPSKQLSDVNITSLVLKKFDSVLRSPSTYKPILPANNPVLSVKEMAPPISAAAHAVDYVPKSLSDILAADAVPVIPVSSISSVSLPTISSVSSSMWSVTSGDERDFSAGLASLDADIKKLQDSLRGGNASL